MKTAPNIISQTELQSMLQNRIGRLIPFLETEMRSLEFASAKLEDAMREADTAQHRRARHSDRDRACYRLGAAFEASGGLALDDVSLTGLDQLGIHGIALLADVAIAHPGIRTLSQLLALLFTGSHGPLVRAWGAYARWQWLREAYAAETEAFLATRVGRDPKATWRRGSATPRQTWLIAEIARSLGVVAPEHLLRGEAFDWIQRAGGNPRWQEPPSRPEFPNLRSASEKGAQ